MTQRHDQATLRRGVQPVELTLYFSETTGKTLPRFIKDFITYVRYLRHLLRSYEGAAEGKIAVSFVDPLTDSDEAVEATQDGLEGRAVNEPRATSSSLVSRSRLKQAARTRFPSCGREEQESIEYEISKRLTSLLWPGSKRDRRPGRARGVWHGRQPVSGPNARRAGPSAEREVDHGTTARGVVRRLESRIHCPQGHRTRRAWDFYSWPALEPRCLGGDLIGAE